MVAKPIKGDFRIRNVGFHCSGITVSLHKNIQSIGVYGYPLADATEVAVEAVKDWMNRNNDYAMDITFCCFDKRTSDIYNRELKRMRL